MGGPRPPTTLVGDGVSDEQNLARRRRIGAGAIDLLRSGGDAFQQQVCCRTGALLVGRGRSVPVSAEPMHGDRWRCQNGAMQHREHLVGQAAERQVQACSDRRGVVGPDQIDQTDVGVHHRDRPGLSLPGCGQRLAIQVRSA